MKANKIDLRHENPIAPDYTPSPNLRKVLDALQAQGEIGVLKPLVQTIERGEATGEEPESLDVYDGFCLLFAYVEDLADMCRRREAALAQQGIFFGDDHLVRVWG